MAVCTDAPAAWVSLKGVFATGIAPAEETVRHSAPPSTELESTTISMPGVLNAAPAATARLTTPCVFAVPVMVVRPQGDPGPGADARRRGVAG